MKKRSFNIRNRIKIRRKRTYIFFTETEVLNFTTNHIYSPSIRTVIPTYTFEYLM